MREKLRSYEQIYLPEPGDLTLAASFDFVVENGVTCETVETAAVQASETPTQPKLVFSRY